MAKRNGELTRGEDTSPHIEIPTGGLVPTTFGEAMQLANMMAQSTLVPPAFQKQPANCLMVIQQSLRWRMDPFAVIQECSVIGGRLMYGGKLVAAVVNTRANLRKKLDYDYSGQGDTREVKAFGTFVDESKPREVIVKLKDAKTNAQVWKTQPDQQLAYHASRVWARRHKPELMLGVYSPEEFNKEPSNAKKMANTIDAVVEDVPAPTNPPAAETEPDVPPHDPETGEILDAEELAKRHNAASYEQPGVREAYKAEMETEDDSDAATLEDLMERLDSCPNRKMLKQYGESIAEAVKEMFPPDRSKLQKHYAVLDREFRSGKRKEVFP